MMRESSEIGYDAFDLGLSTGLGAFETMRADDGLVFALDAHLARLTQGLETLGMPALETLDYAEICEMVLRENELLEGMARLRLTLHAGPGSATQPFSPERNHLLVSASRMHPITGDARVSTTAAARNHLSAFSGVKCISYADSIIVYNQAKKAGYDEVLMPNTAGELCEGATSNVFIIRDGVLITPPLSSGCLPGVTRAILIELCEELSIPLQVESFPYSELETVTEAFLTSSLRNVQAISHIDQRALAGDGDLTTRLKGALEERIRQNIG